MLPLGQVLFLVLAAWPSYQVGLFVLGGNFREVVPDRIYRSGQPQPGQLKAWIHRYNLKTVVNLRGPQSPNAADEEAVAAATGAKLIHVELSATRPMTRDGLVTVLEVLDTAEQPLLLHCESGIERSGLASALAAWLIGERPYHEAKWHAYVPPGPWKNKQGLGHISDTLAAYEDYCRSLGLDFDDPARFREWAANIYDDPHLDRVKSPQ